MKKGSAGNALRQQQIPAFQSSREKGPGTEIDSRPVHGAIRSQAFCLQLASF